MRKARPLLAALAIVSLGACDLLEDKDWREGVESAEDCAARLSGKLEIRQLLEAAEGPVVPTYAYDITKMDLMAINEMIVPASGDERGSIRTSAFGATAPPVEAFMNLSVTEAGAFYFGDDPSLYRVRAEAMMGDTVLAAGCERQQEGMRLTGFTLDNPPSVEPSEDENESEDAE